MDDADDYNFLHCGICGKLLEEPRYLSCLHSFCEKCLQSWIFKTVNPNDTGVTCNVCNIFTTFHKNENVKDLIDHFPRNNFISSLVERAKLTDSGDDGSFCQPCFDGDGVVVPASHWCQECSEVLCKNCANFHKKVCKLTIN